VTPDWILRRALREARRRKAGLVALAAAMAVAAGLGGAALLGARTGAALLPRMQQQVHVIAYLDDGLGASEREHLVAVLRQLPGVAEARPVTPEEALARLRAAAQSLGGPAAIAAVEPGFLPRSVEITVRPAPALAARAAELAAHLRKLPGVAEVDDMSEGLCRLESWLALARRLGLLTLALALVATAAGVATGLAGWRPRRREAEVLRLMGESPLAITLPASLTGALAALLGALTGLILTGALFPRLVAVAESALRMGSLGGVPSLGMGERALTLLAAVLVGGLAGHLGARAPRGLRDA
jgi:cell division protein FtsX